LKGSVHVPFEKIPTEAHARPRVTAHIHIASSAPLPDVAVLVGKALSLTFLRELTGRYKDCPAFVAQGVGLHFALLGPPPRARTERRRRRCTLRVGPLSRTADGERTDISEFLAAVVEERSGLASRRVRRLPRRRALAEALGERP
jgi:hypothetical protein